MGTYSPTKCRRTNLWGLEIFTFFVTVTHSSAPPNVNTFPIYIHDSYKGMGVQLELIAVENTKNATKLEA